MRFRFNFAASSVGVLGAVVLSAGAQVAVNVTQHHNHASRDGLFLEPALTQAAAANLRRDLAFDGTIAGHVYAQPLYLDNGPSGRAAVFVVTESDNVYALDAVTGTVIWQRQVGTPMPLSKLPCGDIDPLGITGTPVIDLPSRTLFLDAMTTPDAGATAKHLIFALDLDSGATRSGWPVDVDANTIFQGVAFNSRVENQRGALAVAGGTLYVPYGGHFGDCGNYRGWLVGVPLNNPASVVAWATGVTGGGAWGVGGVASDGSNLFLATGNTFGAGTWSGGEAIIKFTQGPTFSGLASDYWAPMNWMSLDAQDTDIGSSGPVLMDVPGATPSALAVALGKDGNAYLLNRGSLGGVSTPLAQAHVSSTVIVQAAAAYRSAQGVHVAFCNGGQITSLRLGPANPPTITSAWTSSQNGRGSPFVTSTDGTNNVIVWGIGCEGDGRLHGFDGDTGAVVFGGGGPNEVMGGTRRFNTGIAAHGRIFVAADDKVYAFSVPAAPTVLTRQIPGVINALWDLSLLTNELQNLELRAEKVTRGAINFMQASFAAPYAQDGRGKLAGSGSNSVAWISNLTTPELTAIEATWLSTGSVTGSKGVVRVVYSVKALGQASLGDSRHPVAARAVTARANYAARFDPALNQVTGRRSDTISATGLATLSNSEKIATAFPAELGDGSWTLAVQFGVVNGTKSSGTATVALSSGQIYPFNFTGTLAPRSGQWRLNLKGVDAGLGSILQVTVQASDITRIVGRVSGQSVNIKQ